MRSLCGSSSDTLKIAAPLTRGNTLGAGWQKVHVIATPSIKKLEAPVVNHPPRSAVVYSCVRQKITYQSGRMTLNRLFN